MLELATADASGRAVPPGGAPLGARAARRLERDAGLQRGGSSAAGGPAALDRRDRSPPHRPERRPAAICVFRTGERRARRRARTEAAADERMVLNTRRFRRVQGRLLGLDLVARLAWAKERRVIHAVRITFADGRTALVANFHATGSPDKRIPDAEVLARGLVRRRAHAARASCACSPATSTCEPPSRARCSTSAGSSGASRSRRSASTTCSSAARRQPPVACGSCATAGSQGRVLSDHAPVEVTVT